jgi:hypothetical protein
MELPKRPFRALLLTLVASMGPITAFAQTSFKAPPLWGDLAPGPYAVGFKIIYRRDPSRISFDRPPTSADGNNRTRPIRISVWYPAVKAVRDERMSYSEYVTHWGAPDKGFVELNRLLDERDTESLKRSVLDGDAAKFVALMKTPTFAIKNARPRRERFPLIVYSIGRNNFDPDNAVLWEYLASYGYVIASVPQVGTNVRNLAVNHDLVDLETQMRDLEFTIGTVRGLNYVDPDRLALIGHSMGGAAALLIQMRNTDVDAVIGLDASFGFNGEIPMIKSSPYFDPNRMRVPLMNVHRTGAELDNAVIDSLGYSSRYLVELPGLVHVDFTSWSRISALFNTGVRFRPPEVAGRGYLIECRYILNFLDAYLKGNQSALKFIRSAPTEHGVTAAIAKLEIRDAVEPPPTVEGFVRLIETEGIDRALTFVRDFVAHQPQLNVVDEPELNTVGYKFLNGGNVRMAIDVFRLNVEAHPTSTNTYDSLAEAYLKSNQKGNAIKTLEKLLEVLPTDTRTDQQVLDFLKKNAVNKLKQLKTDDDR